MANLTEVDFSNYNLYELGQEQHWVHEIADGVLTEMAQVFKVELGNAPTSVELGQLVGAIGTSKVLQENIGQVQEAIGTNGSAIEITADWVERSGVQRSLDRSLWTPDLITPEDSVVVMTGSMANWQDRGADLLVERVKQGHRTTHVSILAGNRSMGSPTELANQNVIDFQQANNELPIESVYAREFVLPRLREVGYTAVLTAIDTDKGDEIAQKFAEGCEMRGSYAFARVANAGIQLAVQFRKAMVAQKSDFDSEFEPQTYVLTDTFPIASTEKQTKDAANFQNPLTAIRQVALTAKMLQEVIESL